MKRTLSKTTSAIYEWALILAFLGAVCAPGALTYGTHDRPVSFKRGDLKTYLSEHFGLIEDLVYYNALVRCRGLHVSSSDRVVIGKHGWLFYAADRQIDDWRCTQPFTPQQLEQWRLVLEAKRDWLKRRGIKFIFLIGPNKHSIYPELMPDNLPRAGNITRMDQLTAYMKARSDVAFIDVRPALWQAKTKIQLYAKTDTHWNQAGGFLAAREVDRQLQLWYPAAPIPDLKDYKIVESGFTGMDMARMLGLQRIYSERDIKLRRIQAPTATGNTSRIPLLKPDHITRDAIVCVQEHAAIPRGIFLDDSFGSLMYPFLSEHFDRLVVKFGRDFDPELIRQEHPDVLIQECTERYLMNGVPDPPPPDHL